MSIKEFLIDNFVDSAYCVGYRISSEDIWSEDISKFDVLKPSFRYWFADPIPCEINGENYVFMEQYDRWYEIGHIAVSKLKGSSLTQPKTVIREATHLSFPLIIPFKGNYYMFPESSATGNIEIYQMQGTVYEWKKYCILPINEKVVDISYHMIDKNVVQLVAGVLDKADSLKTRRQIINVYNLNDPKNIYYKIGFTDMISSYKVRNAGKFFCKDDRHYRVVQESTEKDYGMYLILTQLSRLDFDGIEESEESKKSVQNFEIKISPYLYRKIGTHTYGKTKNGLEVIDVSVTKFSFLPILKKAGVIRV